MNSVKSHFLRLSTKNNVTKISKKFLSTIEEQGRRSELFSLEQERQKQNVGRIEKIEVRYLGQPNDTTLVMNKGLSTPYNCAQHLTLLHCNRSALALVDNHTPWDMHRPLEDSCTLQLLHFTIADPHLVNKVFWRSCSFMLGAVLQECFKDEAQLQLHSFPSPSVKSGSFVHDIFIKEPSWTPNKDELRTISAEMIKLAAKNLKIERLDVSYDLALEIFKTNPYKKEQLPFIKRSSKAGTVTVYRVGNHVDISRGPMISSTRQLGRCTITSVHRIASENNGALYRVQGVALPVGFIINHVAYGILEDRSKKLNSARFPHEPYEDAIVNMIA
ncbi:39S ribosomal protein L39, mitochondrial [Pseudolycoriella hygida]|uniref:Large ribosomal subunit protein mL39 n=1 Tax=Pseudolycoriella hygida TaxID=35572 RepID=A0A9Q0NC13_9DIPT|nr:39S ribosomal protein L39, mitochondrial [Pseudolycoriella hygida]